MLSRRNGEQRRACAFGAFEKFIETPRPVKRVRVGKKQPVAGRQSRAGRERVILPYPTLRQRVGPHGAKARDLLPQAFEQARRPVLGPVVHHNDFPNGLLGGHRTHHALDVRFLIAGRNDDGNLGHALSLAPQQADEKLSYVVILSAAKNPSPLFFEA